MLTKTFVRLLILILFVASALIVTISTQTEAWHFTSLNLTTDAKTDNSGSKMTARGNVKWFHMRTLVGMIIVHNHHFTYSLYAQVGEREHRDPPPDPDGTYSYGNVSVSSTTLFKPYKEKVVFVKETPRWENDAYASASASETGNPDNWDFN